jgi:cysteinyl-tRNA synthetase
MSRQNFFTIVKALVGQVEAAPAQSDGHHHYATPERELTQVYVPHLPSGPR